MTIIKFRKLHPLAQISKAHENDGGYDLVVCHKDSDAQNAVMKCHLGIAVNIPPGYAGLLFPRSSIYKTGYSLANAVGVIDSGYTGELVAIFRYVNDDAPYLVGDKCVQLVVIKLPEVELEEVQSFEQTLRGDRGFGSTGK